jgi:probable HAF family extracellular repeat protein
MPTHEPVQIPADPTIETGRNAIPPPDSGPAAKSATASYDLIRLGPEDWVWSLAGDLSEDGRVVGGAESATSNPAQEVHTFLWEAGTLVDLTDLGGAQYGWFANDGSLIIVLEDETFAVYRAEVGTFEQYELELPEVDPPPGFAEAQVLATNRRGEAVGVLYPVSAEDVDGARGFVASEDNVIVLEPAPGGDTSVAWRINDAGQVVGGPASDNAENGGLYRDGRAFLYDLRTGESADLGTLPGFQGSFPRGINNAGDVVGTAWRVNANGIRRSHAFLCDPSTATMVDLNDRIPSDSGWLVTDGTDINEAGLIVGAGIVDRALQGFLLKPLPQH